MKRVRVGVWIVVSILTVVFIGGLVVPLLIDVTGDSMQVRVFKDI